VRRLQGIMRRFATSAMAVLALTALSWALAPPAWAHDIPADVKINAFFKPSGDRLELLVRLPLASLIDTDFPTRPDRTLDIARADEPIRGGITVWLTDNIDVYEDGRRLDKPRLVAQLVSMPSDKSFGSFEEAHAHVLGQPLAEPGTADARSGTRPARPQGLQPARSRGRVHRQGQTAQALRVRRQGERRHHLEALQGRPVRHPRALSASGPSGWVQTAKRRGPLGIRPSSLEWASRRPWREFSPNSTLKSATLCSSPPLDEMMARL
jgi:hypothetical protein